MSSLRSDQKPKSLSPDFISATASKMWAALDVLSDSEGSGPELPHPGAPQVPAPDMESYVQLLVSGGCGCLVDHYAAFRDRGGICSIISRKLEGIKALDKQDQDLQNYYVCVGGLIC